MAIIARSSRASIDTSQGMFTQTYSGGIAGATIPAVCACKVNADGTIGVAASGDAVVGVNARDALAGEPVTLFGYGTRAKFADGTLTPGALLYIGAAGNLDSTVAGTPLAVALNANDVLIVRTV